jgi:hypothetical protein
MNQRENSFAIICGIGCWSAHVGKRKQKPSNDVEIYGNIDPRSRC